MMAHVMPFHEKYEKKEYIMAEREGIDINRTIIVYIGEPMDKKLKINQISVYI